MRHAVAAPVARWRWRAAVKTKPIEFVSWKIDAGQLAPVIICCSLFVGTSWLVVLLFWRIISFLSRVGHFGIRQTVNAANSNISGSASAGNSFSTSSFQNRSSSVAILFVFYSFLAPLNRFFSRNKKSDSFGWCIIPRFFPFSFIYSCGFRVQYIFIFSFNRLQLSNILLIPLSVSIQEKKTNKKSLFSSCVLYEIFIR